MWRYHCYPIINQIEEQMTLSVVITKDILLEAEAFQEPIMVVKSVDRGPSNKKADQMDELDNRLKPTAALSASLHHYENESVLLPHFETGHETKLDDRFPCF